MRTTILVMAALVMVGASNSEAAHRRDDRRSDHRESRDDRWDDRRDDRRDDRDDRYGRRGDRYDVHGDVHIVFSTGDARIVREYYEPRYRRLPPGLRKKYIRTGYLPVGWQRRMEPIPWAVERRLGGLPHDYRRGVIDGHAVIYAPRTGVVIDATVLF